MQGVESDSARISLCLFFTQLAMHLHNTDLIFLELSSLRLSVQTLKPPPMHMIICCGRVVRSKRTAASEGGEQACSGLFGVVNRCTVCKKLIAANSSSLSCINKSCGMMAHLVCLAGEFLRDDSESILPIEGNCPGCRKRILWGDLIRRLNGALDLIEVPSDEEGADSGDNNCSDVALSDDSVVDGEVDGDVN